MNSAGGQFELDPETYDALVDWPKRLANEEPFYRRRFEEVGAHRVLDAACGTGRHVAWFHSWGLFAEGADLEPAMVAYCRGKWGPAPSLNWVVRPFTDAAPSADFDAVVCMGNSLALSPDVDTAAHAVRALLASLRPGGVCITQVVNLWRLPDGPTHWQKCARLALPAGGERILLKGMHRAGEFGHVDFVDLRLSGREFTSATHAARFLGLRDAALEAAVRAGGGCEARFYGSFQETPYDPRSSPDLIMVCRRE
jgi:SAM-dependent methyltransferase